MVTTRKHVVSTMKHVGTKTKVVDTTTKVVDTTTIFALFLCKNVNYILKWISIERMSIYSFILKHKICIYWLLRDIVIKFHIIIWHIELRDKFYTFDFLCK